MSTVSLPIDQLTYARHLTMAMTPIKKRLYLALFYAQRFTEVRLTCVGINRRCNYPTCRTVPVPWVSFLGTTDEAVRDQMIKKCSLTKGYASFGHFTETQLNLLISTIIEFEYIIQMLPRIRELHPEMFAVLIIAAKTLYMNIRAARFQPTESILKYVRSLSIDHPKYLPDEDQPSVIVALANLFIDQFQHFEDHLKPTLYRLVQRFIGYLNDYILDEPGSIAFDLEADQELYSEYYQQWLACVFLPKTVKCFRIHSTTDIFGLEFLRLIWTTFTLALATELEVKFARTTPENVQLGTLFLDLLLMPRFLDYLQSKLLDDENNRYWNKDSDVTDVIAQLKLVGKQTTEMAANFDLLNMDELKAVLKCGPTDGTGSATGHMKMLTKEAVEALEAKRKDSVPTSTTTRRSKSNPTSTTIARVTLRVAEYLLGSPLPRELHKYLFKRHGTLVPAVAPPTTSVHEHLSRFLNPLHIANQIEDADVEYHFLQNDLSSLEAPDHHHLWLMGFVQVINTALPKMGPEYIMRLVFDPAHRSLVVVKKNIDGRGTRARQQVLGGICYRPFTDRGFTEIVFVAVTISNQVKGFGRKLMNRVKDDHLRRGVLYMLTYGDQNALGFFRKQGFSAKIALEEQRYKGFIKEYSGATLLECKLNPLITYCAIPSLLLHQKLVLESLMAPKITAFLTNIPPPVTYTGTASIIPLDFIRTCAPACNFDPLLADFEDHSDQLKSIFEAIVLKLSNFNDRYFVTLSEIVKPTEEFRFPISLRTISERVARHYYKNTWCFHADIRRLLDGLGRVADQIVGDKVPEDGPASAEYQNLVAKQWEFLSMLREFEQLYAKSMVSAGLVELLEKVRIDVPDLAEEMEEEEDAVLV